MSEIAKALTAFHADLPNVSKGSTNPAFKSKYADLADIVHVVLPALAKNGLAWITRPTYVDGAFVLAYELRHISGESISGEWPLPDPTQANPQQLGSAVTYAKRYTLSAVTGIAPDTDDDGNAASAKGTPRASRPAAAQDRIAKAETALRGAADRDSFDRVWDQVKLSGLAGIPQLLNVHSELNATFPASTVDSWAPADPPEPVA